MTFFQSVWSFLSVVVLAWITQKIISFFEKRKRVAEFQLKTFLSWMPFLSECYVGALGLPSQSLEPENYWRRKIEFLGTMQIVGPVHGMEPVIKFFEMAELGFSKDSTFDRRAFHESFTALNYSFCCEIHGEVHRVDIMGDEPP
ncbi:MAG TPA: hypothetical protein VGO67_19190 [Verrucomicrobiae bacterium]|jgi:hypothetical protein